MTITTSRTIRTTALLAAALLTNPLAGTTLRAQGSAEASIIAEVQQTLTIQKFQDLQFGKVFPGLTTTIAPNSIRAALFRIQGANDANISVMCTMPPILWDGISTLPVTDWTGLFSHFPGMTSGIAFDPSAPANANLGEFGMIQVGLGAKVSPPVNQPPGTYTGTIAVTVAYM